MQLQTQQPTLDKKKVKDVTPLFLFFQWSSVCGSSECGNNDHQEKGELDWHGLLNALNKLLSNLILPVIMRNRECLNRIWRVSTSAQQTRPK